MSLHKPGQCFRWVKQGAKKVSFTACHSGKLQLACTSPQVISTSPKTLISRIDYNPSVIGICPKNSTCVSSKLRTKITSPIAKSTSPGLSDTTFFSCWFKANTRQSSDFCIFCSLHDVHHFAEKPVEVLQNCGCFLSLPKRHRFSNDSEFVYHKNILFFEQLNFKILAQFLVCWFKGLSAYLGQISYHDNSYAMLAVNPLNTKSDQHQFSPNNRLQELIK